MIDLGAIRKRERAATKGPWANDGYRMMFEDGVTWAEIKHNDQYPIRPSPEDLEFMSHSREDVPALLTVVEQMAAALDALLKWSAAEHHSNDRIPAKARAALSLVTGLEPGHHREGEGTE